MDRVEDLRPEEVDPAALERGGRAPGFLDDPPHEAGLVGLDGEILAEGGRIVVFHHRDDGGDVAARVTRDHPVEARRQVEDVAEAQEDRAVDVRLDAADRVRDAERLVLLDVLDRDAGIAPRPKWLMMCSIRWPTTILTSWIPTALRRAM